MNLIAELAKLQMKRSRLTEQAIHEITGGQYDELLKTACSLKVVDAEIALINKYLGEKEKRA